MATRPTILIVDDDHFVRVLVRDSLVGLGEVTIVEAADGVEALTALDSGAPDLVFLDLLMPNKSGLETLPEIRKRCPKTVVIVISSLETESMRQEALNAGAAGFIGKPFHPDEVADAARKALARHD